MMKGIKLLLCIAVTLGIGLIASCSKSSDAVTVPVPIPNPDFAKGADVSWVTEMEKAGIKFFNNNGVEQDVMQILKDKGMNAIRLRAWVNPSTGWNNTRDVVIKAKRAQSLGLKLMINLHYSDTWADPGHQTKPQAWQSLNLADLKTAVYNYTKHVMDTLKLNNITPEWVQVGNETNDGMLWQDGKASNLMANFAALVNSGYNAVKDVNPAVKVIVHVSNGHDNVLFRWMFDGLKTNGAHWDIIGMSLYPSYTSFGWSGANDRILENMNDMVSRYGTSVMVVEVGMPVNDPSSTNLFLTDLIKKTRSVTGGKGLGVFYWEPECFNNWKGYGLGAFDSSGKPTVALDAFLEK